MAERAATSRALRNAALTGALAIQSVQDAEINSPALTAARAELHQLARDLQRQTISGVSSETGAAFKRGHLELVAESPFDSPLLGDRLAGTIPNAAARFDSGTPFGYALLPDFAWRPLRIHNLMTLEELARLHESRVASMHGIGPKAMAVIKAALAGHGLGFTPAEAPEDRRIFGQQTTARRSQVNLELVQ